MNAFIGSLEIRQRLLIMALLVDHAVLVLLTLGNCQRGETLSASAWRQDQAGRLQGRIFRPLIDALFRPLEKDHCRVSWLAEKHMYRSHENG